MRQDPDGWPADWPPHAALHESVHAVVALVLAARGLPVDLHVTTCFEPGGRDGVTKVATAPTPDGYFAGAAVAAAGEYLDRRCGIPAHHSATDRRQVAEFQGRYLRAAGRAMPDPYGPITELFGSKAFFAATQALGHKLATSDGLTGPQVEAIVKPLLGDLIPAPKADDPIDDDDDDDTDLVDAGVAGGVLDYCI